MCGIAGFVDFSGKFNADPSRIVVAMCEALRHRGPDSGGISIDEGGRVALGHRRLSIIDLSESGAQPMESASGRYVIAFNGEIYNFLDLRATLVADGVSFRGHSDTEVLLASIEKFGLIDTLKSVNGMFAFALYDKVRKQIIFARDRLGKKPLYIGVKDGVLAFGSELKALRQHPAFKNPRINRQAFLQYARLGYIPAPLSIFENIGKLPAGSFASLSVEAGVTFCDIGAANELYWSMHDAASLGLAERYEDESAALNALEATLGKAVEERLVADVPVGAFLSGGVDSSLVCSIMQERLTGDAKTFTVSFEEDEFDEAEDAAELAGHIGTDHVQLSLNSDAALDAVAEMHQIFDEPFADPSQVPSLLIARLVRSEVTVAISGDGGDEFFAGYKRYPQMAAMDRLAGKLPGRVWRGASALPFPLIAGVAKLGHMFESETSSWQLSGDKAEKILSILAVSGSRQRYESFLSQWSALGVSGEEHDLPPSPYTTHALPEGLDLQEQMMFLDSICYLPDDVLVKVDRTSMAASLEVRSPLLDYKIVEEAWRMPLSLRWPDGGPGKVALRRLLAKRVPDHMIDRPKRGFGIPLNEWLRGPLRALAEEHLSASRVRAIGCFDSNEIGKRWTEHLTGRRNWGFHLWTCICFSLWHQQWMSDHNAPRLASCLKAG